MKYQKTLAVLAGLTFAGALSQAQIAVGDNLTISGFGDLRYDNVDSSTLDVSSFNVTEVEIDFSLSLDKISAEIHLQSLPATQNDGVELEQAFVSTDLGGFTVTAGRMPICLASSLMKKLDLLLLTTHFLSLKTSQLLVLPLL